MEEPLFGMIHLIAFLLFIIVVILTFRLRYYINLYNDEVKKNVQLTLQDTARRLKQRERNKRNYEKKKRKERLNE